MTFKVAILGAGGIIAPAIVRDLAESDEVAELLLLDLDEAKAERVGEDHGGGKSRAARVDARSGLADSLEAFIEHNGQWEKAARELFCHRHTLRYRVRRVEELTGRDLKSARDRIEFWLALRARELVQ